MEYILKNDLSIDKKLYDFITDELLYKTNINEGNFFKGLSECVYELAPINKKLLEFRENIQQKINTWHKDNNKQKINMDSYLNFLKKIGYLVNKGENFQIQTKNLDDEISKLSGPQLVVPVTNPRYCLNAVNSRWGSLYNALYKTDVISGDFNNPTSRKKKVIVYSHKFLNDSIPLKNNSWENILKIPTIDNNRLNLKLKNPKQFRGYNKKSDNLSSLLFKNNNLHIDIQFYPSNNNNNQIEKFKNQTCISDILLESAITTIIDHEDSVAGVDTEDKINGYSNWLKLMMGTLEYSGEKNGEKFIRKLNPDREYISSNGNKIKLSGRSLMLNRNVGHLMTSPSILLRDGSQIPECIMDAFSDFFNLNQIF